MLATAVAWLSRQSNLLSVTGLRLQAGEVERLHDTMIEPSRTRETSAT